MGLHNRTKHIIEKILLEARLNPDNLVSRIMAEFEVSRQAVHKHIKQLTDGGWLVSEGNTRNKKYFLGHRKTHEYTLQLNENSDESRIYYDEFAWLVSGCPKNAEDIIYYGFTEMVNNAIDHSDGTVCIIDMVTDGEKLSLQIADDGEGIFKRIKRLCDLVDERQAIIELSKGKLTTDPARHTGQGIYFASRMFDQYIIDSKGLSYTHDTSESDDTLSEVKWRIAEVGTNITMTIDLSTNRSVKAIFDQFSSDDGDYSFDKTLIPVKLATFGNEKLVSRSQAKRLLSRIENFKRVVFDFEGVEEIGQAFADEIFRVYLIKHPEANISAINTSDYISQMIRRAQAGNN